MRSPTVIRKIALVVGVPPILALAVLAGRSASTEAVTAEPAPAAATHAVALAAASPAAATAQRTPHNRRTVFVLGGTVTLTLSSQQANTTVPPGATIDWEISAEVSTGDNLGLALISVDLVQDAINPELFDIPTGDRPTGPDGMDKFDRPLGISNPDAAGTGSAYGGTQIGAAGAMDLVQIGGAQNNFGETFSGVLEDATIEGAVGQGQGGRVIATGSFLAPAGVGTYTFDLENGVANTLLDVSTPPAYSRVSAATVDVLTSGSFSFTVQ